MMCKKIEGSVGLVYMKKTNSVVSMVKGWGFEKKIKLYCCNFQYQLEKVLDYNVIRNGPMK